MRAIFVRILHIFLILFRKCSVTFTEIENGKSQTQLFTALGPETEGHIKYAKEKLRSDM